MNSDATVTHVIASCAVILGCAYLGGRLSRRLGQPDVIGQILSGIALSPGVVGRLPGHPVRILIPPAVQPYITVLAQFAVVLFLFVVGYEVDLALLRKNKRVVQTVACSALLLPMVLGAGLAIILTPQYLPASALPRRRLGFVIFIAVALSITAVPVLAAIIRERGLLDDPRSLISLASAGVMDGLGWLLLAVAILIGTSTHSSGQFLGRTLPLLGAYLVVMLCCVRPALIRLMPRVARIENAAVPLMAVFCLASACVTSAIGLHFIFGAFFAGLIMPRMPSHAADEETMKPLQQTSGLLLPLFFASAGLPITFSGMRRADLWVLVLFCLLAMIGKIGGGLLGGLMSGLAVHDSAIVGVLLNTRGLTELIVLNVGFQAAIIDRRLYTDLVIMALVTTMSTGPLLDLLKAPRHLPVRQVAAV